MRYILKNILTSLRLGIRTCSVFVLLTISMRLHGSQTLRYSSVVVDVIDGDTIVVSNRVYKGVTLQGLHTVELDGVDAPELDQPGGQEAKVFLKDFLKGKQVDVIELTDQNKSQGGWVFSGDHEQSVNVRLIEEGKAWLIDPHAYYAIASRKPKVAYDKMKNAYKIAKEKKVGIWAKDNPIAPADWIKQQKEKSLKKD